MADKPLKCRYCTWASDDIFEVAGRFYRECRKDAPSGEGFPLVPAEGYWCGDFRFDDRLLYALEVVAALDQVIERRKKL